MTVWSTCLFTGTTYTGCKEVGPTWCLTCEPCADGAMKGILCVSDEPLVSMDFRCTDQSTTIDSSLTMVMVRSRSATSSPLQAASSLHHGQALLLHAA